jgi:signal transduction histidine kinase
VKSLYLRIWLTVVAALALFALTSGWLVQRHLAQERAQAEATVAERMAGWGELVQSSLPVATTPLADQASALVEWSRRLRVPLALDDVSGQRIAASETYLRLEQEGLVPRRAVSIRLDDGRRLWMVRPSLGRLRRLDAGPAGDVNGASSQQGDGRPGLGGSDGPFGGGPGGPGGPGDLGRDPLGKDFDHGPPRGLLPLPLPHDWPGGLVLVGLLVLLFVAVAGGAYPVVRGLTRRLEVLRQGVETFGGGALDHRVPVVGRDEVAAVARSFNLAAERIQALLQSNQSLLANASHELRSPLARLKMAVAMLDDAPAAMRATLATEINTNIAELDALVEEVLLSSRLEAGAPVDLNDPVDLLGLVVEEGARVGAEVDGPPLTVRGNDRLLRRAVRNLLENARRYGGREVTLDLVCDGATASPVVIRVCDRGPGVPADQRERIFEPFYRMAGHAEREGGVGLGLSLVRQIAQRHDGDVHCEAREGGGSCFAITLPASRRVNEPATPRP